MARRVPVDTVATVPANRPAGPPAGKFWKAAIDPLTGKACKPLSLSADQRLGTLPGSEKPWRLEVVLHVISFSVEEGVVGVMAILSTSTTSFDFSCPPTVSRPLPGESGAGLPMACFSIKRSSCIVDDVMFPDELEVLPIDDFEVDNVFEKRLVVLKSPINHGGLPIVLQ